MIPMTMAYLPEFTVPKGMDTEIQDVDVGKKLKATISYEVIRKDETSVTIAIDNIFFKKSKRVRT